METTTAIDCVRGKLNIFDVDISVAIGGSDALQFTCYHKKGDAPVIMKIRGDMNITDAANGKFKVTLMPADTATLTYENTLGEEVFPRALIYEVTQDANAGGNPQLVASGVLYLVG